MQNKPQKVTHPNGEGSLQVAKTPDRTTQPQTPWFGRRQPGQPLLRSGVQAGEARQKFGP